MDKQQNVEARPADAERPPESGAASPGRAGRMSRQRQECEEAYSHSTVENANREQQGRATAALARIPSPFFAGLGSTVPAGAGNSSATAIPSAART